MFYFTPIAFNVSLMIWLKCIAPLRLRWVVFRNIESGKHMELLFYFTPIAFNVSLIIRLNCIAPLRFRWVVFRNIESGK